MIGLIFVALLQTVSGQPAPPADAIQMSSEQQAAQAEQQDETDPADVQRCRTVRNTGSLIANTRVCMSQRDEERLRRETQHEMREMRSRTITGTGGGGG